LAMLASGFVRASHKHSSMTQKIAFPELRERAIALRLAGKSRREIKEILGIGSNETLNNAIRGVPPPAWTMRPRAKDERHAKARELRATGHTYDEIAAELGVSKGSVSLWVRDQPRQGRLSYAECRKRNAEGVARYWARERPIRAARQQAVRDKAAAEVGGLNDREVLIAGAIAYWCEGSKNKPYRRPANRVIFINSDPALIAFFLRLLAVAGVAPERLICRVHIHESADVAAAQQFWLDQTGLPSELFRQPILKRHNPKTVRKNTGEDYHGCLIVAVRRSTDLYLSIEGWAMAAMSGR
jgi:DNA-binding CsgD family transcriptional regulator